MSAIDTNILGRYIVRDDAVQLDKVNRLIRAHAEMGEPITVPVTVILTEEFAVTRKPSRPTPEENGEVVLLSGGNPKIPKGHGDAPVQAYIAALPDWKQDVVRRLDALIVGTVPDVRKAVKWNSPLYGMDGTTWFLGIHVMTRYVKVAFFNGKSLDPMPPVDSKTAHARYLHVSEKEPLDEAAFVAWVKVASAIPGEKM